MAGESKTNLACLDLSQPEILSKKSLVEVIKERCPKLGDVNNFEQNALLELFYMNVSAMPQRKYRSNRRGLLMTKKQILNEKHKRKHEEISGFENPSHTSQPQSGVVNSVNMAGDRLKPPPSCINFNKNVVKLSQSSSSVSNLLSKEASTKTTLKLTNNSGIKTDVTKLNRSSNSTENSQLSDIVINCKKYGNRESHTNACENRTDTTLTDHKVSITPNSRIKLKRTSTTNIDSAMDVELPERTHKTGLVNSPNNIHTSPEKCNVQPNKASHSSGEQISVPPELVTEEQKAKSGGNEDDSSTDAVQKKFKRIAVQWP